MALDKHDLNKFLHYTLKSELDKALHVLEGIVRGIAIDGKINTMEIAELTNWYKLHKGLLQRQAFDDLVIILDEALEDGYLSAEEKADIIWICNSYTTKSPYYDLVSSDIQKLYGLLHGIIADNKIELKEIEKLNEWLLDKDHLTGVYPYDELFTLVLTVLKDGQLTIDERNLLKAFFSEFIDIKTSVNLNDDDLQELRKAINITGVCSVCPQIVFQNNLFCFTGRSSKATQVEIKNLIESAGGKFKNHCVKDTAYLIVANQVNPCWAFACYGRKVEQAVKLRKAGSKILIVDENDFWNELQSHGDLS